MTNSSKRVPISRMAFQYRLSVRPSKNFWTTGLRNPLSRAFAQRRISSTISTFDSTWGRRWEDTGFQSSRLSMFKRS